MSKTVVVVGASRGIGLETVKQFAEQGHKVYALSRKSNPVFEQLGSVEFHSFDLNSVSIKDQLAKIFKSESKIDVLINNAGYLVNKPFEEITTEDLLSSYQVNVIGVIQTVQSLVSKMLTGGHILNISSMGGFQGSMKFAGLTAYSTSKAALCSFTELFSEEYKDEKVAMNCLCLGAVQTEMLAEAFPGYEAPTSPSQMAEYIVEFSLNGHQYFKGKILPVSLSTP